MFQIIKKLYSKDRGKLLTSLILISILLNLDAILKYDINAMTNYYGQVYGYYLIISYIIYIPVLIGIWFYKKIAVYSFFVFLIIDLILGNATTILNADKILAQTKMPSVFHILIPTDLFMIGIYYLWYFAIKKKWQMFK